MAKERSNTTAEAEAVPKKEKKQKQPTRAGAVFGSILLFLLTLLFGICFLCSSILNSVLPQKTLSAAIAKMDLSQIQLSDHGKEQLIGKCLYDWYFWDAPNLTEEYAEKLVTMPECNQFLCDYLDDLSTYMTGDNSELPQLQPDDVADLLQEELGSKLTKETHMVFAEADRKSLNWTMGDDLNGWNSMLQHTIGSGFGKFLTRQLCNLSGMIAFGVLTVACFVLWLVLAVKKHWHKGRMFTAYGLAVAIPGLLVLAASGVTLLLVEAFHIPDALIFSKAGLPILLKPVALATLIPAAYGVLFTVIGICTNAAVKSKKKKAAAVSAPVPDAPAPEAPAPQAPDSAPAEPEFRYTETSGESHAPKTDDSSTVKFCPHCGAMNPLDSQFCGSCGKKMD